MNPDAPVMNTRMRAESIPWVAIAPIAVVRTRGLRGDYVVNPPARLDQPPAGAAVAQRPRSRAMIDSAVSAARQRAEVESDRRRHPRPARSVVDARRPAAARGGWPARAAAAHRADVEGVGVQRRDAAPRRRAWGRGSAPRSRSRGRSDRAARSASSGQATITSLGGREPRRASRTAPAGRSRTAASRRSARPRTAARRSRRRRR